MGVPAESKPGKRSLSEAVHEPTAKPALGRPHDLFAAVLLVVFFAASMFFVGHDDFDANWLGMLVSLTGLVVSFQYLNRAYGFPQRRTKGYPLGTGFAFVLGVMLSAQLIAPALYAEHSAQGLPALITSYLTFAVIVVAPVRMALGKAPIKDKAERG